jgi:hypothetical protein
MDFRPTAVDVPGDFSNPMVVFTVVIWALGLATITVSWLVLRRSARPCRLASVVAWGILVTAYVSTPLSQRVLGSLLYLVGDLIKGRDPWVSVGFIGGPPFLPAPVFALLFGFVAALLLRGKSSKNTA